VWTLGGTPLVRRLAFPLFLLFFMVPDTGGPLQPGDAAPSASGQQTGRRGVERALDSRDPRRQCAGAREPEVERCGGVQRHPVAAFLTFLSLVYGYFFEKKQWLRVVLFFSTIPIAIIANAGRVTVTALVTQIKAELAEGFFHELRAG